MNESIKRLYLKALKTYGPKAQRDKAIEELAECITELARLHGEAYDAGPLIEEIADARIMLEQMSLMFGIEEVDRAMVCKRGRLAKRIDIIKRK